MSRLIFSGKISSETVIETFAFTSRLAAAETISTASVAATVYSGTDATPSAVISGSSTITGQKVTQKLTGGTLGVIYKLVCTITTSLGQTLLLTAFLAVVPDTQ